MPGTPVDPGYRANVRIQDSWVSDHAGWVAANPQQALNMGITQAQIAAVTPPLLAGVTPPPGAATNPFAGAVASPFSPNYLGDFTGALPIAGNFEYQFYEGTRAAFNQYGSGRMTNGEMADLYMRGTAPARVIGAPWSFGPSATALQSSAPPTAHTPKGLNLSLRARNYARRGFARTTIRGRWRL